MAGRQAAFSYARYTSAVARLNVQVTSARITHRQFNLLALEMDI